MHLSQAGTNHVLSRLSWLTRLTTAANNNSQHEARCLLAVTSILRFMQYAAHRADFCDTIIRLALAAGSTLQAVQHHLKAAPGYVLVPCSHTRVFAGYCSRRANVGQLK